MVTSMICDEICIFRDKLKENRYMLTIITNMRSIISSNEE